MAHKKKRNAKSGKKSGKSTYEEAISELNEIGVEYCALNDKSGFLRVMDKMGMNSDIMLQERDLQRKADQDIHNKIMLVKSGQYTSPAPYSDGDQSPLNGHALRLLKNQWGGGMDYNALEPSFIHLSDWLRLLFKGNYKAMMSELEKTEDKDIPNRLEHRESLLNVSAIFHVIIGARTLCGDSRAFTRYRKTLGKIEMNHLGCFLKLLELGAKVDAKDVAGYTPLHHCLTKFVNDITFKMATVLLSRGVDPNVQNRFGATPLFEPTMNGQMESIDLLVQYGADPNITDNDNINCNQLARLFPKITSLFMKSSFIRAKAMRKETASDADGSLKKCVHCGKGKDTKRCSGCLVVWYCCADCLRADWVNHKSACKLARTAFIPIKLKTRDGESIWSWDIEKQDLKESVAKGIETPSKKQFTVKVQIPLAASPDDRMLRIILNDEQVTDQELLACHSVTGDLMIYNRDKTCNGYLPPSEPAYASLVENVKAFGLSGVKGFFYATWDEKKGLRVNTTDIQPIETW